MESRNRLRRLEHVIGNTFEDSNGRRFNGKLLTKRPVLLSVEASEINYDAGRIEDWDKSMGRWLEGNWDNYFGVNCEVRGNADAYVMSWNAKRENGVCFCAVNFYKTKPVKER